MAHAKQRFVRQLRQHRLGWGVSVEGKRYHFASELIQQVSQRTFVVHWILIFFFFLFLFLSFFFSTAWSSSFVTSQKEGGWRLRLVMDSRRPRTSSLPIPSLTEWLCSIATLASTPSAGLGGGVSGTPSFVAAWRNCPNFFFCYGCQVCVPLLWRRLTRTLLVEHLTWSSRLFLPILGCASGHVCSSSGWWFPSKTKQVVQPSRVVATLLRHRGSQFDLGSNISTH